MGKASRNKRERRAAIKPQVQNVTKEKVDDLLGKLQPAEGADGAPTLSPADVQLTHDIIETWAYLMGRLRAGKLTIKEMKQLAGIVEEAKKKQDAENAAGTSEGQPATQGAGEESGNPGGADDQGDSGSGPKDGVGPAPSNRHEHGRRDTDAIGDHEKEHHEHTELKAGDPCPKPDCSGRIYPGRPKIFTTIGAEPPFKATEHTVDVLECNKCGSAFAAPLPEPIKDDLVGGNGSHLYAISAIVMITLLRYFSGFPWYRQEGFFTAIGSPRIPDASMADQAEKVADAAYPIYLLLRRLAASAWLLMADDTGGRILSLPVKVKEQRSTGKETERNGCHTTAVIALVRNGDEERRVVLFDTGIHYSGEILDELLASRDPALPRPYIVGDGSDQNDVTVTGVIRCGCNAHAVRRFKACLDHFPDEAGHALEVYDRIYKLEAEIKAAGLSPEARLARHRDVSKPLLDGLCRYAQSLFDERKIEKNSDIGEAFNYLLNQQRPLMAFTRYPGIPLDNNEDEQAIKLIVLVRKNSQHFASVAGAGFADVLWSCGATALRTGENPWDYFRAVVRHKERVRANPEAFLPWNWRQTVAQMQMSSDPI